MTNHLDYYKNIIQSIVLEETKELRNCSDEILITTNMYEESLTSLNTVYRIHVEFSKTISVLDKEGLIEEIAQFIHRITSKNQTKLELEK